MKSGRGTEGIGGRGVEASIIVNGREIDVRAYREYHGRRIARTLEFLTTVGARRIIEVGGHPWVMTRAIIQRPELELVATISAEERTLWPDDIGVTRESYCIHVQGDDVVFPNYSANVERRIFPVEERADTVVACEILEHLLRSPHVFLLNANRWLPGGGNLLVTTPNGAQFRNPLRRRPPFPAFRAHIYERHSYVYTIEGLLDLLTVCGFRVERVELWSPYPRSGPPRIYGLLSRIPIRYFEEKFARTIAVWATKDRDVVALERVPRVYDPSGPWEHVVSEPG